MVLSSMKGREGLWLAATLVAVSAAMVVPIALTQHWILNSDGTLYFALATAIAAGHGYVMPDGLPAVFRAPGLPLLIDMLWLVTGHSGIVVAGALAVAQGLLVAAAMGLSSRLAPGLIAPTVTGLLLISGDPVNRGLAGTIRPDGLMAFLALGGVLLWVEAERRRVGRLALISGLLMGLSFAVKQTGLSVVLVPIGVAALQRDRPSVRLALRTVFAAGMIPALWYAYLAINGVFLMASPAMSAAVVAAELSLGILVAFDNSPADASWPPGRSLKWQRVPTVFAALGICALLVGMAALALQDRIEISHRSLMGFLLTEQYGVPGLVLALLSGLAIIVCIRRGGVWQVTGLALLAAVPVTTIAWLFDLRASQYALGLSLATVAAGGAVASAVSWAASALAGSRLTNVAGSFRVGAGIVLCGIIAIALAIPQVYSATRLLRGAQGDQATAYRTMAQVGAWLKQNAPPGSSVGFDEEPLRAIYWQQNAAFPLLMAPQLFVAPTRNEGSTAMRSVAWVDIGSLHQIPPAVQAPIIRLGAAPDGSFFVVLEQARFLSWLRDSGIRYLIVSDQPSEGLGNLAPYLNTLPGLTPVPDMPIGNLTIYKVTGPPGNSPTGLWATDTAIGLLAREAGISSSDVVKLLNPLGRADQ